MRIMLLFSTAIVMMFLVKVSLDTKREMDRLTSDSERLLDRTK